MEISTIFWVSFFIVFYTYVGYGVLVTLLVKLKTGRKRRIPLSESALPEVTLVIAAFNEEKFIAEKIKDCLQLDYPSELLNVIVVTDGSTDNTPEIVSQFPSVKLLHDPVRKGKIHAVNRAMKMVTTPVTIFCDANTFLSRDCIRKLVRHFDDATVGGVAGEKRVFHPGAPSAVGSEGLYWKYESFLKTKDAELNSVVGAAGELFSIRTALFEPPPTEMIIEDFYLSMKIVQKGFRFEYEPEAYALEAGSSSVDEEWKRKVRISAGAFQAMGKLRALLNPFKFGLTSFQYISHRILRWTLAPLALPFLFVSNLVLALQEIPFYQLCFALQCCFYFMAFAGHVYRQRRISVRGFFLPYYFTMMNASVFAGFLRFLKGRQTVLWERAERAELR